MGESFKFYFVAVVIRKANTLIIMGFQGIKQVYGTTNIYCIMYIDMEDNE
jgi:hypothetical protein